MQDVLKKFVEYAALDRNERKIKCLIRTYLKLKAVCGISCLKCRNRYIGAAG